MTAIEMPSADVTVTEHLLGLAPGRYGRAALVDPLSAVTISYSGLAAKVRAAAAGLMRRGVRPGDVTGVHVTSPVTFALASQSIRAAGAVTAPMSAGKCGNAIAAQLTACDARILVTDSGLAGAALDIAENSRVRQVISFGQPGRAAMNGVTRFDTLLAAQPMRPVHRSGDQHALLAWTYGPDGSPQRVPVTHGELVTQLRMLASDTKLATWDVILAGPPSGDGRGYSALLDLALAIGATIVSAPSTDPAILLALGRSYRASVALVPPGSDLTGNSMRRVTIAP